MPRGLNLPGGAGRIALVAEDERERGMAPAVRGVVIEHLRRDELRESQSPASIAHRAIDSRRKRLCDHASGPGVARRARTTSFRTARPSSRCPARRSRSPRSASTHGSTMERGGSSPRVSCGTLELSSRRVELLPRLVGASEPEKRLPRERVTDRPRLRVTRLRQGARGLERFLIAAAVDQEVRELPQVERPICAHGLQRGGFAQRLFGELHLPLVLVTAREQIEVVAVVPVQRGIDLLGGVVGALEGVGFLNCAIASSTRPTRRRSCPHMCAA